MLKIRRKHLSTYYAETPSLMKVTHLMQTDDKLVLQSKGVFLEKAYNLRNTKRLIFHELNEVYFTPSCVIYHASILGSCAMLLNTLSNLMRLAAVSNPINTE